MVIYTPAGNLAFRTFTFPDGQPHFKLETYGREFDSVTIETSLASPADLLTLELAIDVLRHNGYSEIRLDIRYLLGARMDRSIGWGEPSTLAIVARRLNSLGLNGIRILDVHSDVATKLIRNSVNVLPKKAVGQVIATTLWGEKANFIIPDKGANNRVWALTKGWGPPPVQCDKRRDEATGKLSGFHVGESERLKDSLCLIIDDICDGGGTFVGLAKELKAAGASKVFLYVTHGIFSKGLPLDGIDHVYTTDSYPQLASKEHFHKDGRFADTTTSVIPISMKELT